MVCCVADGLRNCSWSGGCTSGARAYSAIPAFRNACRDRSPGLYRGESRTERPVMKLRPVIPFVAVLGLPACNNLPGRPGPDPEVIRPEEVLDFAKLYAENCSGCHGADGKGNAAIALRDPVYLAIADDSAIRNVASRGVRGTPMPPFAQSMGGILTDKQIDVL